MKKLDFAHQIVLDNDVCDLREILHEIQWSYLGSVCTDAWVSAR